MIFILKRFQLCRIGIVIKVIIESFAEQESWASKEISQSNAIENWSAIETGTLRNFITAEWDHSV